MLLGGGTPGIPSFSTSTLSAASVGSPTRVKTFSTASYPISASLHSAQPAASSRMPPPPSVASVMPRTLPTGSYETPSTSYSRSCGAPLGPGRSAVTSEVTVIWLVVSVPVLSVQMTVVQPSVSTEGSLRTTTFRAAIRLAVRGK